MMTLCRSVKGPYLNSSDRQLYWEAAPQSNCKAPSRACSSVRSCGFRGLVKSAGQGQRGGQAIVHRAHAELQSRTRDWLVQSCVA